MQIRVAKCMAHIRHVAPFCERFIFPACFLRGNVGAFLRFPSFRLNFLAGSVRKSVLSVSKMYYLFRVEVRSIVTHHSI